MISRVCDAPNYNHLDAELIYRTVNKKLRREINRRSLHELMYTWLHFLRRDDFRI